MRRLRLISVFVLAAVCVVGPALSAAAAERGLRPTALERAIRWLDDGFATLFAGLFQRESPAPKMAGEIDPNG